MKYVYALKNRLVNAWTDPHFENAEPKDKARYLNNFCILNPDKALEQHLNELDLYCLGTFDDEKGIFDLKEPELLICLDQPFETLRKAQAALGAEDGKQA